MKKVPVFIVLMIAAISAFSQWIPVGAGLGGYPPVSMYAYLDTLYLGTEGGGVHRTTDQGNTWQNISGNLPTPNINDIRPGPASTVIFVATTVGPFYTTDLSNYQNCSSPGLTQPDINYFWFGGDDPAEWAIGSNGGGIFTATDYTGPWVASNTGISGSGLIINDLGGYSDASIDYAVAATDGGVYFSNDNLSSWTVKNNGLSGDALLVTKVTGLGSMVIIATRGGLFMTTDGGDNWMPMIPDEPLNTVFITQSPLSSTGFFLFAFGVNGFYTEDFISFEPVDLGGMPEGEVTCAAVNSGNMFLGITVPGKSIDVIYRKPLDQVVGSEEPAGKNTSALDISPNPCTDQARITVRTENPGTVLLTVHDHLGRPVRIIDEQYRLPGIHTCIFSPGQMKPGIYLVSMQVNGMPATVKKIVLVR